MKAQIPLTPGPLGSPATIFLTTLRRAVRACRSKDEAGVTLVLHGRRSTLRLCDIDKSGLSMHRNHQMFG